MLLPFIRRKIKSGGEIIVSSLNGADKDYTTLPIHTAVYLLAIPMVLELGMESVFALTDIFFVNHWLGNHAVMAVGLTESVVSIVYALAIGISMAATAVVARRTGEKDAEGAAKAAMQAIWLGIITSFLLAIPGMLFAEDILRLMGADAETIQIGVPFTQIMLGGNLAIMLLFLINGIFRGAGNATIAMKSLWIANIFNIILNPLLIWQMGLSGAAIATCIGRGIGVVYQVYHLVKGHPMLHIHRHHVGWERKLSAAMVKVAAPATLQFLIGSGSWILLARLVAQTGGATASAGYQTAIRVLIFFILPAWGLSNAAATLVGQHLGAGQPQLAEKSVHITARYNAIFMAIITALFIAGAPLLLSWFTNDAKTLQIGIQALQIVSTGYIFYGIGMVMTNALNGAGDTRTPTLINLLGFWCFQIPFAWWLAEGLAMGPTGVFIAIPVAETLMALAAWYLFTTGKWKTIKV